MIEMPRLMIEGVDTVVPAKVHALARTPDRGTLAYASLVCSGNAAKVIRAGLAHGFRARLEDDGAVVVVPKSADDKPWYDFRQAGLGHGHVHVVVRAQPADTVMVVDGSDDEWHRELCRVSTAPVLPEFVPWLREKITADAFRAHLTSMGCDAEAYKVSDERVVNLLIDGAQSGALDVPECDQDMGELQGLSAYVHAYAEKMVEASGSQLQPLFDPKLDRARIPKLKRDPFAPQAWVIEAVRRAVA